MKKYRIYIIALALLIALTPVFTFASDISNAWWKGTIRVFNSGTETSNVSTVFTLDTQDYIDAGYISSNCSDIAIQYASGDTGFMPGYGGNPWCVFVSGNITPDTYIDYDLYTGGATGGELRYFPATGGMSVSDNANLECGDNFTIEVSGFIDTSVTDNIVRKDNAIWLGVTETGEITGQIVGTSSTVSASGIAGGEHEVTLSNYTTREYTEQLTSNYYKSVYGGDYEAWGILIDDILANTTINSLHLHLRKGGSPTGTANVTVRDWTTHSIIGQLGDIDVSTISGAGEWYAFNNSVNITTDDDISITFEYNGGDASNRPQVGYTSPNIIDGFDRAGYLSSIWIQNPNEEIRFRLYMDEPLRLYIDDSLEDYEYSSTVSDTANNWVFFENIVMPYVEYAEIEVEGSQVGYWEWQYASTFIDQSGNGNTATPTFRTTSSDADVSANLTAWEPARESKVDTVTLVSSYEIMTGNVTAPTNMFSDLDFSNISGPASVINELLTEADVPQAAWWFPLIFLGICIIGMTVYGATSMTRGQNGRIREGQLDGSLLFMVIVIEVLLVIAGKMGPIPYWPAYLFPIAGIAITLSKKHFSWG